MEKSLILVKPDGLQRGLVGEIISRFERKGLKIIGLKMFSIEDAKLEEHYDFLVDKPFFGDIKDYMQSSPLVAIALEGGEGSVAAIRILVGTRLGQEAPAGTIRGDFGVNVGRNLIHGSDAQETAQTEIALWFKDEELVPWQPHSKPWLNE